MKFKILGWKNEEISIVNRLEQGFIDLGHENSLFDKPDILIAINPDVYPQAIQEEVNENGIKIFNVLDVPEHLLDSYPVNDIKEQLNHADFVTCISKFTKKQVKKFYGVDSEVVYTPCMEIEKVHKARDIDFLYVGRASDPNKRFNLVLNGMIEAGMSHSNLTVCGPDPTSHGVYKGVVPKSQLNELYHKSKVVLLPSKIEGVGLSMIEGALAGAIPLMCNDNKTAIEFGFKEFTCEPTVTEFARQMMMTLMDYDNKTSVVKSIVKKNNLFDKFNSKSVAQKYIDLYENRTDSVGV